jgi:hypothetical protein
MPFIAILNALIREKVFTRFTGEPVSHQISTLTLMVWMTLYTWLIFSHLLINTARQAWIAGLTWLILTLLFEFFAGHYVFKNPWKRILNDYNLSKGRVWGIFVIYITCLPYLILLIKN